MEADSGRTNLHPGGSIAGQQGEIGTSSVEAGGKGHEDEVKVCELHGHHFKLVVGSYF